MAKDALGVQYRRRSEGEGRFVVVFVCGLGPMSESQSIPPSAVTITRASRREMGCAGVRGVIHVHEDALMLSRPTHIPSSSISRADLTVRDLPTNVEYDAVPQADPCCTQAAGRGRCTRPPLP